MTAGAGGWLWGLNLRHETFGHGEVTDMPDMRSSSMRGRRALAAAGRREEQLGDNKALAASLMRSLIPPVADPCHSALLLSRQPPNSFDTTYA